MRTSSKKINPSLKRQIIKTLAQSIADFKNLKEVETFLMDFFKDAEIETYAKRFAVAYWLKKGRSYAYIKQNLKVSSATIADISNGMGSKGFELGLKNAEAEEWATQWTTKLKSIIK